MALVLFLSVNYFKLFYANVYSITKSLESYSVNSLNLTKFSITTDNLSLVSFNLNNETIENSGFRAGLLLYLV